MTPNLDQFLSWLRTTMSGVGYLLTSYGVTGADTWWPTVSGIILAVVPYVWGYVAHSNSAKLLSAKDVPGVEKIKIDAAAAPPDVMAVAKDANVPKVTTN